MSHSMVDLGLIGAGRIGRLHADNLRRRIPAANLLMVADLNEAAARDCADRLQVPTWASDCQELIERPEIQAVLICSSTDTHSGLIEAAAAAGKHIFCEKPIDVDLARMDRALAAVHRAGVILQVGFNRRFDANFRRVHEAVQRGEIGAPHQIHVVSRDPAPPPADYVRKSGGIFLDMTIHDFDMAYFLAGSAVEEVYAVGGVLIDPMFREAGDCDTALIVLKFACGAMGVIENSRQAVYGYDQRVEVFGSLGSIRIDNNYPNSAVISSRNTVHRDLPLHFFTERYTESYVDEMRRFVEAVRSKSPSPLAGSDARVAIVSALAARRSLAENRPVRLTEVDPAGAAG